MPEKKQTEGRGAYEWVQALVCSVLTVVLIFTFAVRIVRVSGESMWETLQDQDMLVVLNNWLCGGYEQGDIVILQRDDFYGGEAFKKIGAFLRNVKENGEKAHWAMVGYHLKNTLTENGHVARGVCVEKDGVLDTIVERTHIEKREDGPAYTEDDGATWHALDEDTTVSMNLWGFTPDFVDALKKDFVSFLENDVPKNPLKAEYFLPFVVNDQIRDGKADVTVLKSADKWFGVTYKADKPVVMAALAEMMQNGTYPDPLWK